MKQQENIRMTKNKKTVLKRALPALGLLVLCIGLTACKDGGGNSANNSSDVPDSNAVSIVEASQAMRQALIDDWQDWMSKTEMQRAISSKRPGSCWKYFGTWAEAVDYLGFEPWNPLETADWLTKMNYAGTDVVMPEDPGLMHSYLLWNGENAGADTQVSYYALTSGYADGAVNVVIEISNAAEGASEPVRTDSKGEKYDSSDLVFERDGLRYRVSVISHEGTEARDATYNKVSETLLNH